MKQARQTALFSDQQVKCSMVSPRDGYDRPQTYKGIYAMHKYWSKKSHNLVARYIERFSERGDIVLDSFCGSGITVMESLRLQRRAIGIDINPIAIFMTKMAIEQVNLKLLKNSFYKLKNELETTIDALYYTECSKCGNSEAVATHTIWKDNKATEIWYKCSKCGTTKGVKEASIDDGSFTCNGDQQSLWYPKNELFENTRINAKAGMRVSDLFTPRALIGLSLILKNIRRIENTDIKAVLEFCFSAALSQASKMVFVIRRRGKSRKRGSNDKAEVGSWVIGYWVPSERFEIHTWRCFENRFKRILKGKEEVNRVIPSTAIECSNFEQLREIEEGYWASVGTATALNIPSESIDYAFVDPPHGNRVPYLEQSLMWNAWLGFECDWESEIIVSEAKNRNKDIIDYRNRLAEALGELWRVLKPNKYASVVFNSLDDDVWLSMLNSCLGVGFKIRGIDTLAYSARSVVQDNRNNALKTDFVITYQKKIPRDIGSVSFEEDESLLKSRLYDYLANCRDGAETYEILNHLFITSIPSGRIFKISRILDTLKREFALRDRRWFTKSREKN